MSDQIQIANRYDMDKVKMASRIFAKALMAGMKMIQDKDDKIQGSEVIAGYMFSGMDLLQIMGNDPGDVLEFTYQMNRIATEYIRENHDQMKIVTKGSGSSNPIEQFINEIMKDMKKNKGD